MESVAIAGVLSLRLVFLLSFQCLSFRVFSGVSFCICGDVLLHPWRFVLSCIYDISFCIPGVSICISIPLLSFLCQHISKSFSVWSPRGCASAPRAMTSSKHSLTTEIPGTQDTQCVGFSNAPNDCLVSFSGIGNCEISPFHTED